MQSAARAFGAAARRSGSSSRPPASTPRCCACGRTALPPLPTGIRRNLADAIGPVNGAYAPVPAAGWSPVQIAPTSAITFGGRRPAQPASNWRCDATLALAHRGDLRPALGVAGSLRRA
ncbi:hypothetical protein ACPA9J_00115 [Pseudomonas aeruginosa]